MRLSVGFGVVALVAVSTIGCAQSNSNELGSPAAPTSLSDSLAAGPGAGYNASGEWTITVEFPGTGETDDFDAVLNQDAGGNITFVGDDGSQGTLTRLGSGNGRIIAYRVSSVGESGGQCQEQSSGTVRIDTQANTGRGHIVFVEEDCFRGTANVVLTKK